MIPWYNENDDDGGGAVIVPKGPDITLHFVLQFTETQMPINLLDLVDHGNGLNLVRRETYMFKKSSDSSSTQFSSLSFFRDFLQEALNQLAG
jgi:hypothetical protein